MGRRGAGGGIERGEGCFSALAGGRAAKGLRRGRVRGVSRSAYGLISRFVTELDRDSRNLEQNLRRQSRACHSQSRASVSAIGGEQTVSNDSHVRETRTPTQKKCCLIVRYDGIPRRLRFGLHYTRARMRMRHRKMQITVRFVWVLFLCLRLPEMDLEREPDAFSSPPKSSNSGGM